MKAWNKFNRRMILILGLLFVLANVILYRFYEDGITKDYIIEVHRIHDALNQGTQLEDVNTASIDVTIIEQDALSLLDYTNMKNEYIVVLPGSAANTFYRFACPIERIPLSFMLLMNGILLLVIGLCIVLTHYIKHHIIHPFHSMEAMADALAHRDFEYELPQHKYKFFGKFIWAMDILKAELKYKEQKEYDLMKEKKTLIASLSHDIKNPLSNIRLYSEAITQDIYPKGIILQRIDENCDKIDQYMKEIIKTNNEDLFDFSITMHEVYMNDILKVFSQEAERITLALVKYTQATCDNALVVTDIYRLKEVIHNVIDNALKYGDGKRIDVSFYQEDYHQIIKITNSGNMIDVRDTNAIFQSFYRGNNVDKQVGNGLGLYICKQLMKRMDGDIFLTQSNNLVSFHIVLGCS